MSFVVYASPSAYLFLSRSAKTSAGEPPQSPWKVDIPTSVLQSYLSRPEAKDTGVTIASLILEPSSTLSANYNVSEQIPHLGRPKFRLQNTGMLAAFDHTLPIPMHIVSENANGAGKDVWVLDFTDGGRSQGVVVTHTRMREIQQVLDPLGGLGGDMQMPPFPGNWAGLLVSLQIVFAKRSRRSNEL